MLARLGARVVGDLQAYALGRALGRDLAAGRLPDPREDPATAAELAAAVRTLVLHREVGVLLVLGGITGSGVLRRLAERLP